MVDSIPIVPGRDMIATLQSTFSKLIWLCLSPLLMRSVASIDTSHRQTIQGVAPLLFQGTLLNDLQNPISNASIQLWQTDPLGIYDHPNAAGSNSLDDTFQYCGTAETDMDGSFSFLTHRPGAYANRPTHFHYKVWMDGREMLTSQFYFDDENTSYSDMQIIELQEYEFDNGVMGYVADKTIVLDMNLGGNGPFTPSDMEGPFYPVFDFFGYGNNLINASFITSDEMDSGAPAATVQSPTQTNASVSYDVPTSSIEDITNENASQQSSSSVDIIESGELTASDQNANFGEASISPSTAAAVGGEEESTTTEQDTNNGDAVSERLVYTLADVQESLTENWIVIHGTVYEVSDLFDRHPTGPQGIEAFLHDEASRMFPRMPPATLPPMCLNQAKFDESTELQNTEPTCEDFTEVDEKNGLPCHHFVTGMNATNKYIGEYEKGVLAHDLALLTDSPFTWWVSIHGRVYNITRYLNNIRNEQTKQIEENHPMAYLEPTLNNLIVNKYNEDATDLFSSVYPNDGILRCMDELFFVGILDTRFDEVTSAAAVQSPTNNNASVSYAASDQNTSIEEVSTSAAGEEESTTMEHDTNNGDAIVKSTSNSGAGQSQFCVTLCVILILQCSLFL
jgi:cytochrome b involved in lipid metabolism